MYLQEYKRRYELNDDYAKHDDDAYIIFIKK